jgi:exoribonuclease-2
MFKNNPALLQLKSGMVASVSSNRTLVEGVVRGTRQNYGFLQTDDGESYFIAPPQMGRCLPGDRVSAAIVKQENGKEEAILESVITPLTGTFLGTVRFRGAHPFIVGENPFFKRPFRIPALKRDNERDGDIVIATILKHPFEDEVAHAMVTEVIAHERDRNAAWKAACARHNIGYEPPVFNLDDVPANASRLDDDLPNVQHMPFVTIDGEYTRDIDDALHAELLDGGRIRLNVAIADAERFITPGSATDLNAFTRGFTTYLPGHSIPMLPKVLSEQGASLVEGQPRHAVFCTIDFSTSGDVIHSRFWLGSMCSHAKLSYDAVQSFLDGKLDAVYESHHASLRALNELCTRRIQWRVKHAITSSGYSDYRFVVEDFVAKSVSRTENSRSQKLVEECMVAANVEFATFMQANNLPCIYRRHDGFKAEKTDELVEMLKHHGINTTPADLANLSGFKAVMNEIKARGQEPLELLVLGFMARGRHSTECGPHFSVGFERYATFTSPIRKCSDLINHRSLKNYLLGKGQPVEILPATIAHLDDRTVETGRAERDVHNDLYAKMYETQIGASFRGKITSILEAGARVQIIESGASGFISTRSLGRRSDEFTISADGLHLLKNGSAIIALGEELDVFIESVEMSERSINCTTNPAR